MHPQEIRVSGGDGGRNERSGDDSRVRLRGRQEIINGIS